MKKTNKGWLRVLGLIIPYFIIVGIFQIIGFVIAGISISKIKEPRTTLQEIIIILFTTLGTFLTLWIFTKYIDKKKFINLGFHTKNKVKEFGLGILIGFFIMVLGFGFLYFLNEIEIVKFNFNVKETFLSIAIFTLIAVNEEVLCRGYILKNFMVSFNKYIALTISALLFAIMHLANPNMDYFTFFDLFLGGYFLGLSYIYTKNLWFPIALHLSWNLFQSLLGFNVSGKDMYSVIELKINDVNRINGGNFGFEGSIFSILFQIIVVYFIWRYYNKKNQKNTQTCTK